jgi:SSS family solute:Na+ symporter
MTLGLGMLYKIANPLAGKEHFGGSQWALSRWGFDTKYTVYVGILAVLVNALVAVVLTVVFRAAKAPAGDDVTSEEDYHVEAGDAGVTVAASDLSDTAETGVRT